jgi:ribosomal protein S27AE|tara:strand:+ start:1928 stop:2053 length:126 start_codon:yes stop_codon:yes gene_type:complete
MTIPILKKDGSCQKCNAEKEKFMAVLGGKEVCGQCGHMRSA